jgi:hypothetical protein
LYSAQQDAKSENKMVLMFEEVRVAGKGVMMA